MNRITVWIIIGLAIVGAITFLLIKQPSKVNNQAQSVTPTVTKQPIESIKTQTVMVTINGFEPQTITVPKGTKVDWINKSGNSISINSANHPTHTFYPTLNLGMVKNDDSVSLIFDTPGTYKYHNHLDASQTGMVIVQ